MHRFNNNISWSATHVNPAARLGCHRGLTSPSAVSYVLLEEQSVTNLLGIK